MIALTCGGEVMQLFASLCIIMHHFFGLEAIDDWQASSH
jgi:hypothetical protein